MAEEKNFENRIKQILENRGIYPLGLPSQKMYVNPIGYYEKRWGGGAFIKEGLPDLHIVVNGVNVEVELKSMKGKPSMMQVKKLKQIDESGSYAILLYPDHETLFKNFIDCLIHWDNENILFNYDFLKNRLKEWVVKYGL